MTIHYHGTPITPKSVLYELAGRHFCVSFADPRDIEIVHKIGQSVMLDNGAFSFWRKGERPYWEGYYEWVERWQSPTTWAVIPDVIDGTEEENDDLLLAWPFDDGAPVWHLHESLGRLERLAAWPRLCIGSSGQYATLGDERWHRRMTEAFNAVDLSKTWVHMLRGMSMVGGIYPFASVDSTDIARNHNRPHNGAKAMAERWDGIQCSRQWQQRPQQMELGE